MYTLEYILHSGILLSPKKELFCATMWINLVLSEKKPSSAQTHSKGEHVEKDPGVVTADSWPGRVDGEKSHIVLTVIYHTAW